MSSCVNAADHGGLFQDRYHRLDAVRIRLALALVQQGQHIEAERGSKYSVCIPSGKDYFLSTAPVRHLSANNTLSYDNHRSRRLLTRPLCLAVHPRGIVPSHRPGPRRSCPCPKAFLCSSLRFADSTRAVIKRGRRCQGELRDAADVSEDQSLLSAKHLLPLPPVALLRRSVSGS